jgi:hypothetical protein
VVPDMNKHRIIAGIVSRQGERSEEPSNSRTIAGELDRIAEQTGSEPPVVTESASTIASCMLPHDRTDALKSKERHELLNNYKSECKQHGVRVTDRMIAEAASSNWHGRTAVQKWLACDRRYDGEPDRLIRRVFAGKPHIARKP